MLLAYAQVVAAILVIAIVVTRGDRKRLTHIARRMAIPLAIIGLAMVAFTLTRTPPPPVSSVNGIYRNFCCEQIELRNGKLITSRLNIAFRLNLMKYGLETQGIAVEAKNGSIVRSTSPDCGSLLFADDRRSFTVANAPCGRASDVVFSRM